MEIGQARRIDTAPGHFVTNDGKSPSPMMALDASIVEPVVDGPVPRSQSRVASNPRLLSPSGCSEGCVVKV